MALNHEALKKPLADWKSLKKPLADMELGDPKLVRIIGWQVFFKRA